MTLATQDRRVVIITPARDEADFLPQVIAAIADQRLRPARWIIVDDGSTDSTLAIARWAAAEYDWIRVVERSDRGGRTLGSGVIEAFECGRAAIDCDYDYIAKMDADVTVGPDYLVRAMERFENDPRLGALSGKVYRQEGQRLVEEFMIDEMVAGQWKLYRRAAFEEIGGFVPRVMWDGIDFHEARRRGWTTLSAKDPELAILHHRLMGSSDKNVLVGRLRWGRGQWFLGSHPLYVLASSAFRMLERPRLIGGALIFFGYLQAWWRRCERYEATGFRADLQRWQLGRLRGLLGGNVR